MNKLIVIHNSTGLAMAYMMLCKSASAVTQVVKFKHVIHLCINLIHIPQLTVTISTYTV